MIRATKRDKSETKTGAQMVLKSRGTELIDAYQLPIIMDMFSSYLRELSKWSGKRWKLYVV